MDAPPATGWALRKARWKENMARQDSAHQHAVRIVAALEKNIQNAAAASGVSEDAIREYIFGFQNIPRFRTRRAPNLKNVAVHLVSQEWELAGKEFDLHVGKPEWEKRLESLRNDEDAAEAGRAMLLSHRELEAHRPRVSRKGRETDQTATTLALQREAHAFNVRTRGHIFGFTVKGDPLDYGAAQFFGDDIAEGYLRQVLGKSGHEVAKEFEVFAIHGARGVAARMVDQKVELKASIRKILLNGLRTAVNDQTASMHYVQFGRHIEDVYAVTLEGWPGGVITNPSTLGITELKVLQTALLEGTCRFRKMTPEDKHRRLLDRQKEAEVARSKRAIKAGIQKEVAVNSLAQAAVQAPIPGRAASTEWAALMQYFPSSGQTHI